jgi:Protein of unknown function (DUF3225)
MTFNDPDVVKEVRAQAEAYERALMDNDVAALDAFFWDSPHTVRYGVAENLYGFTEIAAFRLARAGGSPPRERLRVEILALGPDTAVVNTEFRRPGGRVGRQSQTWMRLPGGWKICAAHVSLLQEGTDNNRGQTPAPQDRTER